MYIAQMIDLLYWGGAQKLLVTFTAEAKARGVTPIVISLRHDSDTSAITEALQERGAEVVVFEGRGLLDPQRIWRIGRFLRERGCVALHTHLTYANIIGTLSGRLAGVPVIASLHNVKDDMPYYNPARARLEAGLLGMAAHRVVAVGHIVAEANRERFPHRVLDIIPNAVDFPPPILPEVRARLRAEIMGDSARPMLISVGRLSPQKAHQDMLAAMAILRESHPEAVLVLAGDGPLREAVTGQIETLGLEAQVRLLGMRDDVPQLLAASDVFVSSSHWEGLPIAVLEALAAGLPVVATEVGDVPKVVVPGTGLIVPPHAPEALASGLRTLLEHRDQMSAMGIAARQHVVANHSAGVWCEQLLGLYREECLRMGKPWGMAEIKPVDGGEART